MATPSARSERLRIAPGEPLASRRWFKRSQRLLGRDWPTAYLFFGPTLLLLGLIGYPFLQAVWFSFHSVVGFRVVAFVGLDNYITPLGRRSLHARRQHDVTFTAFSEVFKLLLGLATALLLHNCRAGARCWAG